MGKQNSTNRFSLKNEYVIATEFIELNFITESSVKLLKKIQLFITKLDSRELSCPIEAASLWLKLSFLKVAFETESL